MSHLQTKSTRNAKREPAHLRIRRAVETEIVVNQRWEIGSCIYTEDEICRKFSTSRITAMRVLNDLQDEGYVKRIRGKGTVLLARTPRVHCELVHILSPMLEHFHAPLVHRLASQIGCFGAQVMLHSAEKFENPEKWEEVVSLGGAILVEGGGSDTLKQFLSRDWNQFTRVVFLISQEKVGFPASYVDVDFKRIGYLQAAHALAAGYEKIIFLTYPIKPYEHSHQRHLHGIQQACAERGISPSVCSGLKIDPDDVDADVAYAMHAMQEAGKGCAVLANSDYHATFACLAAERMGWRPGADVGIMGVYNTPWANAFSLTSVSFSEEQLVKHSVEILENSTLASIDVEPEVIVRNSTCFVK